MYYVITNHQKQPNKNHEQSCLWQKIRWLFFKDKGLAPWPCSNCGNLLTGATEVKGHGGGGGQLSPRPILQKLKKEQVQINKWYIIFTPSPLQFLNLPPPLLIISMYYVITNQLKQSNEIMNDLVCDRKLGDRFLKTKV